MLCAMLWAVFVASCSQRRCSVLQWNPDVATQLVVASEDDRTPTLQMWDLRNHHSPVKEFVGHVKVGRSNSSHGSSHDSCVHKPCGTNGMSCIQSPSISTCSVGIVIAGPVCYHEAAAAVMKHINCENTPCSRCILMFTEHPACAVLCCPAGCAGHVVVPPGPQPAAELLQGPAHHLLGRQHHRHCL